MLSELLAEHWGEMISQSNSATVSSRYTQLFQVQSVSTIEQNRIYFVCKYNGIANKILTVNLIIAGKGDRDRVWGPVFTWGPDHTGITEYKNI